MRPSVNRLRRRTRRTWRRPISACCKRCMTSVSWPQCGRRSWTHRTNADSKNSMRCACGLSLILLHPCSSLHVVSRCHHGLCLFCVFVWGHSYAASAKAQAFGEMMNIDPEAKAKEDEVGCLLLFAGLKVCDAHSVCGGDALTRWRRVPTGTCCQVANATVGQGGPRG